MHCGASFSELGTCTMGSRKLASLVQLASDLLTYHNGEVMQGDIPISITRNRTFSPTQKSIISDFLLSLTPSSQTQPQPSTPSVPHWWNIIDRVYLETAGKRKKKTNVALTNQVSDDKCSVGKYLKTSQIPELAAKAGPKKDGIVLVFTAEGVAVEGFCMSRCGLHGSDRKTDSVYIWFGNPALSPTLLATASSRGRGRRRWRRLRRAPGCTGRRPTRAQAVTCSWTLSPGPATTRTGSTGGSTWCRHCLNRRRPLAPRW
ncbi:unnamed protein product, partial [Musa textilis]